MSLWLVRIGTQWTLWRSSDGDGIAPKSMLAASPDPLALDAALRLLAAPGDTVEELG